MASTPKHNVKLVPSDRSGPDHRAHAELERTAARILAVSPRPELLEMLTGLTHFELDVHVHADSDGNVLPLIAELERHSPQILLLDLSVAAWRDPDLLGALRKAAPELRVILLWEKPTEIDVDAIIDHPVRGCQQLGDPVLLGRAIRTVLAGETWLPRWLEQRIIQRLREQIRTVKATAAPSEAIAAPADSPLSLREREVFDLVRGGLSNKEIARRLHITDNTVKKHLKQIFRKLGIRRRIQIALFEAPP